MMKIDYAAAEQLAADLQTTHASIDDAIANVAMLTQSVVQVCRSSEISAARSQATMSKIAEGFSQLIDARSGVVGAHRQINRVQRDSDLQTVDFGCDNPNLPRFSGNHLHVVNG